MNLLCVFLSVWICASASFNSPDGLEFGQKKLRLYNLNNVKHSKYIIIHRQRICSSATNSAVWGKLNYKMCKKCSLRTSLNKKYKLYSFVCTSDTNSSVNVLHLYTVCSARSSISSVSVVEASFSQFSTTAPLEKVSPLSHLLCTSFITTSLFLPPSSPRLPSFLLPPPPPPPSSSSPRLPPSL